MWWFHLAFDLRKMIHYFHILFYSYDYYICGPRHLKKIIWTPNLSLKIVKFYMRFHLRWSLMIGMIYRSQLPVHFSAWWHLESLTTQLFVKQFIRGNNKQNHQNSALLALGEGKLQLLSHCEANLSLTDEFLSHRFSNANPLSVYLRNNGNVWFPYIYISFEFLLYICWI